jgi:hypothetical protein
MPKYQYRGLVEECATQDVGFAYFVLVNPSGSGRKLTLRSLEVYNNSSYQGTAATAIIVSRNDESEVSFNDDITSWGTESDPSWSLSSYVKVYRGGGISVEKPIHTLLATRQSGALGTQNTLLFGKPQTFGARKLQGRRSTTGSTVEHIMLRAGEAFSLYCKPNPTALCNPIRVNLQLCVNAKCITYDFIANGYPGTNLCSVINKAGSSDVVEIISYSVMDVGTSDTPTLKLVPVGQMYAWDVNDTCKQIPMWLSPLNTTYPAPPSGMKMYTNIGFIPYGVPEVAISAASPGGLPKGLNYLHTRDFDGPVFRNMLAEPAGYRGAGNAFLDNLGYSYGMHQSDWLVRDAALVINPGEGIAVVNSAETAVTGAAFGGWPALSFGMTIDDAPINVPVIATSGIVAGSRWSLERVSDGVQIAAGVSADGNLSYTYTTEDTPLNLRLKIRKASGSPYYKPYEVSFNLTYAGITLPAVVQDLDE